MYFCLILCWYFFFCFCTFHCLTLEMYQTLHHSTARPPVHKRTATAYSIGGSVSLTSALTAINSTAPWSWVSGKKCVSGRDEVGRTGGADDWTYCVTWSAAVSSFTSVLPVVKMTRWVQAQRWQVHRKDGCHHGGWMEAWFHNPVKWTLV